MIKRRFILIPAVLLAALLAADLGAGAMRSAPANRPIGAPPVALGAEAVRIPLGGGSVAGWFARGRPGGGAVLLLHGVRSDRRQMAGRARFLHDAGYSVLLIDLPAHGESSGARISFGYREAAGVEAALAYLRQALPRERIGVIGVSLGAASLVLSHASPPPDAVILESMYPTIEEAVADRLKIRLGAHGAALAPLLLWQMPLWAGITPDQLHPIARLPALHAPVLIAAGTADQHTTVAETQRLFDAAAAPKALWLVEGAAHVDLYAYDSRAYEARVAAFLQQYLRAQAAQRTL